LVKVKLLIGSITRGGREEVRIQVKEPFASELAEYIGETVILIAYFPETDAEKALSRHLKESRIRP